jgi:hypothetical protein
MGTAQKEPRQGRRAESDLPARRIEDTGLHEKDRRERLYGDHLQREFANDPSREELEDHEVPRQPKPEIADHAGGQPDQAQYEKRRG